MATTLCMQTVALAQEQPADGAEPAASAPSEQVEEVFVLGRLLTSSQSVLAERIQDASVVDTLGSEAMERLGDSSVANALRRIPGLSLVADKFVYIRGLGERYSATSLNGAQIPSPDLTRNVIPLDLFPTSVVESLRVQKAWSADLPANFAGGTVDVRTKGIPNAFDFNFEFGTGTNTSVSGDGWTYLGGGDDGFGTDDGTRALSPDITTALNEYQGNVDTQRIFTFLRRQSATATLADAQLMNRTLATELNRDITLQTKDIPPDGSFKLNIGNRYDFGRDDDWQFGFLLGTSYATLWREQERKSTNFNFPTERTDTEDQSTHTVNASGTLNMGVNFADDHEIETTHLFLRDTDDEASVRDYFNENREISDGLGFRDYQVRFEERNMRTNQISGTHSIGEGTRERLPKLTGWLGWVPEEATVSWYYSESTAETQIPNEVVTTLNTVTDPFTREVVAESVALQSNASDYRFTDLDDEVRGSGWEIAWPIETNRSTIEIKGGGAFTDKARTYRQSQFGLGALAVADQATLSGPLDEVFSDANILSTANNFVFARQGTNNQSYIAATKTDAAFGMVDWTFNNTWRLTGGARWEAYRQAAVDWNPYGFSQPDPQVTTDPVILERGTFQSDEIYPALSGTYMGDWWAEQFQLRVGFSETTIRPDLREITDASYIDPITDDLIRGNSGVIPADVDNIDIRAEWFFANDDSFTVTLFDKDIANPIEFFESAASDTTVAREIINAESAWVKGVEIEGLKDLSFLGGFFETLFLQGNLTVQDSELVAGPNADAPTNPVRKLTGASDYVANFMIGYDSRDTKHSATLIFNVFGERLYVAGRAGAPDGYEQPFESLDFTYSWYPTDKLTFKAKAQNLLDSETEIEREDIVTFTTKPGQTFVVSAQWRL